MGGIIKRQRDINDGDNALFRPINNQSTDGSLILIPQLRQRRDFRNTQQKLQQQMQLGQKKQKYQDKWYEKVYFTPQSKFIIAMNYITLALIYLYFLQIPITIAFENHRKENESEIFFQLVNIPAIIILIIGILVKFKTAFYRQGILIYDQKQIIWNYFAFSFFFDFLSITSIIIYQIYEILRPKKDQGESPKELRFIVILFYLKIPELFNIEKSIIASFQLNRRVKAFFKLMLLLIKIFMLCNVAACLFFFVSDNTCPLQQCADCCWVQQVQVMGGVLKDSEWIIQYTFSLYWASTTMLTIGYGDITPANKNQVIYTVTAQFISCVTFAFSINEIWSIIQEKNSKRNKITSRMNVINVYMRDKNVSLELKSRVNAYLSHFYHTKNLRQKQLENEIIQQLTPSLKKQLYFESYGFLFKTHPFFKYFSAQFLQDISQFTREVGFYQQQIIYSPKTEQSISLYYLHKGELQSYIQLGNSRTSNIILQVYEVGALAGLYQFVRQINYISSLMAVRYSLMFVVQYQKWIKCIKQYEEDFQNYCSVKHKAQYQKKFKKLKLQCKLCGSHQHQSDNCLQQEIQVDTSTFLAKYLKKAQRVRYQRKNTKIAPDLRSQQHMVQNNPTFNKRPRKMSISLQRKQPVKQNNSIKKSIFHKKSHNEKINKILKQQKEKQSFWQEESQNDSQIMGQVVLMTDVVQNYQYYWPVMNATTDWGKQRRRNTLNRMLQKG